MSGNSSSRQFGRLALLLALLVAALGAVVWSGCGGGDTTTVTVVETAPSEDSEETQEETEPEAEDEEATAEGDCAEKEINDGARKEGTCVEDGTKVVVADKKSVLKMESLEAKLLDIREEKSISSFGETATANGVFVIFEIEVTNLDKAPRELEEAQTILLVDEGIYSQDFNVQNGFEEQSFLWQATPIQPQGSMVGTVTFDVPEKVAKNITANGNLNFVNFGAEYFEPEEFFEQEEVGTIRTYQ